MPKFGPWLLAPVSYGGAAALLFLLAHRAGSSLGRLLDLAQLLDPRHLLFGHGTHALVATLVLLAVSVWRKSQLAILVTVTALFAAAYFDVLRFIAIVPKKVDFRLGYVVQLALQLGWLLALCAAASVVVALRQRLAPDERHLPDPR